MNVNILLEIVIAPALPCRCKRGKEYTLRNQAFG